MSTASIEIGGMDYMHFSGSAINGKSVYQEALLVGAATATTAAVTTAMAQAAGDGLIARIAPDTDCYVATGTTPDPTATTSTAATSARRRVSAGSSIELKVAVGDKIAVKSFP